MDADNPYSAPTAKLDDYAHATDMEKIRRENIRHEIQLKSIGSLYGLAGILMAISGIAVFLPFFSGDANLKQDSMMLVWVIAFYIAMSAILLAMAYGFRKLLPWVKIPGTLLAAIGLLGIPVGTMINGYILYLMWCAKGQTVLGAGYQEVIRATPHVKYQRSLGDKIALGIVLALLIGAGLLLLITIAGW